jgi:hypothetical protein
VFLVIAFVNLKINLPQSFECTHMSRMCVRVFIKMNIHMCINIRIYTIFLKKIVEDERGCILHSPKICGYVC